MCGPYHFSDGSVPNFSGSQGLNFVQTEALQTLNLNMQQHFTGFLISIPYSSQVNDAYPDLGGCHFLRITKIYKQHLHLCINQPVHPGSVPLTVLTELCAADGADTRTPDSSIPSCQRIVVCIHVRHQLF